MIGPILILVSWVLLRLEGRSLKELGFDRPKRRTLEFALGLGIAALFAIVRYTVQGLWNGAPWQANPAFALPAALEALRWVTNSVLYEELLFRGYLLYLAIRFLGARRGCYLSAIVFGAYHWFSYGVFGSLVPMAWVFLLTASFGLMLSVAFARSGSVAMPIGLHMGWNLVSILVFSDGPLGPQLLVAASSAEAASAAQTVTTGLLLPLSLPIFALWLLRRLYPEQHPTSREPRARTARAPQ